MVSDVEDSMLFPISTKVSSVLQQTWEGTADCSCRKLNAYGLHVKLALATDYFFYNFNMSIVQIRAPLLSELLAD